MRLSINSFLLATFAKNLRFGSDITSFYKRYQILSLIYVHLSLSVLIVSYDLVAFFLLKFPEAGCFTLISLPFAIAIPIFLEKGRSELASFLFIPYMHTIISFGTFYFKLHFGAIFGLTVFTHLSYFIRLSPTMRNFNVFLGMAECLYSVIRVYDIFKITLSDEQHDQITVFIASCVLCYSTLSLGSFLKSVEGDLWNLAQKDFKKSEALTKEVFQAAVAKDTFVSSLSHEIRNPLNAMKGSIDYLLEVVKDPVHLQMLQNARLSGEVLLNLVNNVLDAAKLKSEMMEISCTESDFESILKKVLIINNESLKRLNIKATAYLDECLPKALWIDASRILQILMNLFSNALKFTPKSGQITIHASWCSYLTSRKELVAPFNFNDFQGENCQHYLRQSLNKRSSKKHISQNSHVLIESGLGFEEFNHEESECRQKNFQSLQGLKVKRGGMNKSPRLRSESESWVIHLEQYSNLYVNTVDRGQKDGFLKVQISDTGCGIPEKNIPKLFEMFFQVHESKRIKNEGTGLGLWICKQLCQKMGGDIQVYSQFQKGTTFVFYIPVSQTQSQCEFPILRSPSPHDKLHVLIADDYDYNRELHKLLLEQEGANVTLAADGKEAVEKFQAKPEGYFDLLMFDVQMPVMDGFTAAKIIRKWEEDHSFKKIDIYFVSGEYFSEEDVLADFQQKAGTDSKGRISCLKKPIDMLIVRKVLSKYKKQEECS